MQMSSPDYQVRILDANYTLICQLDRYLTLQYRQQLNGVGSCSLTLAPNDPKLADIDLSASGTERIRRIQIIRNGEYVYGGLLERIEWTIPERAPQEEHWTVHGGDHGLYLNWRLIIPNTGYATYDVTDSADDVLKDLVRHHAGSLASASRQFSDLSVAADAGAAPSYECHERYTILLNALQEIAARDQVWWRMTPGASGVTFTTGYPLYGMDRTRGNGTNSECIFSLDRRNFLTASWVKDRTGHANYVYVGGQGEGTARTIIERSDSGAVTAIYRRERFIDARQLSATASLQARGDAALNELAVKETMDCRPIVETWKATSGTTWDLGDKVTVDIYPDGGREFTMTAVVAAIDVTIDKTGIETVVPILEAV